MASIYVYSPSSRIIDTKAFTKGVARLKALGHAVEVDVDAKAGFLRFAGDDETRLRAIQRAADSHADIAMVSRGGYGLTRLLPHLPYHAIHKASAQGTRFVGLSDFTALQAAAYAKNKTITWAGPSVGADFGFCDPQTGLPDDIMEACFDDLVQGQGEGAGWRLPVTSPYQLSAGQEQDLGAGVLWGGNLCVLLSLLGTPYFPKVKNGILWLEDIAEPPYKIERMLNQLHLAGVLAQQRAIVLGQFTAYNLSSADKGFKLHTVERWLANLTQKPVLTGLPFGHVPTKVVLPFGLKTQLSVSGRDALLFWG